MKKLKEKIIQLLKYNNSPEEIALGVACGVFIGISPFYGFHTILVVVAAFIIPRTNKIAILLGTNVSLPPTLPLITWAGYSIGKYALGNGYPDLTFASLKTLSHKNFLHFYYPLLVGSLILGLVSAFIFYYITLMVVRHIKEGRTKNKVFEL